VFCVSFNPADRIECDNNSALKDDEKNRPEIKKCEYNKVMFLQDTNLLQKEVKINALKVFFTNLTNMNIKNLRKFSLIQSIYFDNTHQ
jgi:hypothetical protein